MPTAIELTLSTLLPTLSLLPPELIDLSTSLLAQSRSKAATLKPEEEIARTYACCHIACQRLGHRLALQIATPAPPVKPRVYQKLHAYFNSALATPKASARKRATVESDAAVAGANKRTPAKSQGQGGGKVITPSSATKRTRQDERREVPEFVMPIIRHLCRSFDAAEAAPHSFAGVQSLLNAQGSTQPPAKRQKATSTTNADEPVREDSIPFLIASVFNTVCRRMYSSQIPDKKGADQNAQIIDAVKHYCKQHADRLPFSEDQVKDISSHQAKLTNSVPPAWQEMEWYQNTPTAEPHAIHHEDSEDQIRIPAGQPSKTPIRREKKSSTKDLDIDEEPGAAGLLPGLGTMFQPAIDWLSDERRAHFVHWRAGMTRQLALMQQKV